MALSPEQDLNLRLTLVSQLKDKDLKVIEDFYHWVKAPTEEKIIKASAFQVVKQ